MPGCRGLHTADLRNTNHSPWLDAADSLPDWGTAGGQGTRLKCLVRRWGWGSPQRPSIAYHRFNPSAGQNEIKVK